MISNLKNNSLAPAVLTGLLLTVYIAVTIIQAGGDPLALVQIGTRFSQGDPQGTEGYDGQFVVYIASDPRPETVASHLDVPAYRYQRILLPLLARLLSFGAIDRIPWVLAALGIISQTLGTWGTALLLKRWGISPWFALVYGLWVGFVMAVRLDLPEPLAYGLVVFAILAFVDDRHLAAWMFLGLAVFAKDVVLPFTAALFLVYAWRREWLRLAGLSLISILPFVLFQLWLWSVFGAPGLGSGGQYATPFEWIPFMGLLRVGYYDLSLLLVYLIVFGPSIILPTLWGLRVTGRRLMKGEVDFFSLALLLQALSVVVLPFSTFAEPGGLLRYVCGLLLAGLLFIGRNNLRKVFRYAPLWILMIVILWAR
jgi:hypothetical protein